jgi:orotate phosphoribosyltransferase
MTRPDLLALLDGRRGHFELESGHHGALWLELDALFVRPGRLTPFVDELARRLDRAAQFDAICGPLFGGALIAYGVAERLERELFVAEPGARDATAGALFSARYTVPDTVRGRLSGKRVAVVDDVVNAASATRATVADLRAANAQVVAVGALLVLGSRASDYTRQQGLPLVHVGALEDRIWPPASCPLCAAGKPLENLSAARPART